jgi:hypothetical protein
LLAGWRVFLTNVAENRMTLNKNTQYFIDSQETRQKPAEVIKEQI